MTDTASPLFQPALARPTPTSLAHRKVVAFWLFTCAALIFAMVVLGGVTRLTGSGLSMVEWDPIFGVVPPLSQAEWQEVFAKYQQSPEYQKINYGMDLHGFKTIYWFEFAHRLLGRTIGMVFLIPFLFFLVRGWLGRPLIPKLLLMFVLGGLQGVLGWYMVKSGLVDNPHVSPYRLTAHLAAAFVIYGYILWVAWGLLFPQPAGAEGARPSAVRRYAWVLTALIALTVLAGGFVAGLKAGLAYNTFPLMDGQWIPDGVMRLDPWYLNFFENVATVQFDHRLLALLTFAAIIASWLYARRFDLSDKARVALGLLLLAGTVQVVLGVSTLLLHVPVALGAAHQGGALLVLTIALFLNHQLRSGPARGA
jgi:heme a synthase